MLTGFIAGNLGRDAEIRATQGGAVCSFSVAVEQREGREKKTTWVRCSLWGKRGEALVQYLQKGSRVAVVGELSLREYEGKTSLNLKVSEVTLLGGGAKREEPPEPRPGPANNGSYADGDRVGGDDEIPF